MGAGPRARTRAPRPCAAAPAQPAGGSTGWRGGGGQQARTGHAMYTSRRRALATATGTARPRRAWPGAHQRAAHASLRSPTGRRAGSGIAIQSTRLEAEGSALLIVVGHGAWGSGQQLGWRRGGRVIAAGARGRCGPLSTPTRRAAGRPRAQHAAEAAPALAIGRGSGSFSACAEIRFRAGWEIVPLVSPPAAPEHNSPPKDFPSLSRCFICRSTRFITGRPPDPPPPSVASERA